MSTRNDEIWNWTEYRNRDISSWSFYGFFFCWLFLTKFIQLFLYCAPANLRIKPFKIEQSNNSSHEKLEEDRSLINSKHDFRKELHSIWKIQIPSKLNDLMGFSCIFRPKFDSQMKIWKLKNFWDSFSCALFITIQSKIGIACNLIFELGFCEIMHENTTSRLIKLKFRF